MRIIAGKARGKKLKTPDGDHIRPTLDRIRENIYNMIGTGIRGSVFLDLFSGTGAMGIEALSRGANKVYFVDSDRRSYELTQYNIKSARLEENALIYNMEAERALEQFESQGVKFDIIFLDPPYNKGIVQKILQQLEKYNIMQDEGTAIVETDRSEETPESIGKFFREREKNYAATKITFYGVANE